jgi:hypothetical protein
MRAAARKSGWSLPNHYRVQLVHYAVLLRLIKAVQHNPRFTLGDSVLGADGRVHGYNPISDCFRRRPQPGVNFVSIMILSEEPTPFDLAPVRTTPWSVDDE